MPKKTREVPGGGNRNTAKWRDVPQLPRGHWECNYFWRNIERGLVSFGSGVELRLDPEYQRGHVWTEDQQRAYVEYILMGGEVGQTLTWNSVDFPNTMAPIELVDGKQRLTAVRKFIAGDLECFGQRHQAGDMLEHTFRFRVCSLDSVDVLRLYLNINAGGTPHTAEEIDRVRGMLAAARGES